MSDHSRYYNKYEDQTRPLIKNDIPALMTLMMDRLGVTEFEFTIQELFDIKGEMFLDCDDVRSGKYTMRRVDD